MLKPLDANTKLDEMIAADAVGRARWPRLTWADIIARVGDGTMIELGVGDGGSYRMICDLAWPRIVFGFDWFRGLPEDWGGANKGVFDRGGVPPEVEPNSYLITGRIEDTLPGFVSESEPAAFVHFDLDIYSATKFALDHLRFQRNAILVFDEIDYDGRNEDGEQRAFREWLRVTEVDFDIIGRRHFQAWVVRLK